MRSEVHKAVTVKSDFLQDDTLYGVVET